MTITGTPRGHIAAERSTAELTTPVRAPSRAMELAPGLLVCALAATAALVLHGVLPQMSPLLTAMIGGAVIASTVGVSTTLSPGIAFCTRSVLRVGVALLGLQLVMGDILGLGWPVIIAVMAVVSLGIGATMALGAHLGLPWTQRVLIACGFSICGAAAVAAADGVIEAKKDEVGAAIGLVAVFGTLMIPAVDVASTLLHLPDRVAGAWAGASIHEVAQVVATGSALGTTALAVAVVVKLARVLTLAPVLAVVGILARRRADLSDASRRPPLIPLFVLGFVACVVIRSLDVLPTEALSLASTTQTAVLTAAMFALGTAVRPSALRAAGRRTFLLAAASTAWVAIIALVAVSVAV